MWVGGLIKYRVVVIEIKPDFTPYGEEYTQVSFGIKIPTVAPKSRGEELPMPKPIMYKHLLHVFIPREKWSEQYRIWEEYILVIHDDGRLELKKG